MLVDTVAMLRERGYGANASNRFDRLLDDYDLRDVDLVIFGGMVPPEKKEQLQVEIRDLNPRVTFMPGLGGVAPLLVAQVEEFFSDATPDVGYDAASRVLHLTLDDVAPVMVEGIWGVFVPPEPVGHSMTAFEGELGAGEHEIPIPDEVPFESSFAAVRVGSHVSVIRIGATPQAVRRIVPGSLPAPEPVSTRLPWA
ncbi:hypothetical protein ACFVTX_08035 [Agromyces sp. NPDC058136]|uniref:hypothetical protein n=1 Tax=Agromyces sp. NPDC058136 TaxID=3346354 RepID=UPI0036DDAEA6